MCATARARSGISVFVLIATAAAGPADARSARARRPSTPRKKFLEFKMDIEVQNMHLKNSKICFEDQKMFSEGCFKTKLTFENILEYSRVIPA